MAIAPSSTANPSDQKALVWATGAFAASLMGGTALSMLLPEPLAYIDRPAGMGAVAVVAVAWMLSLPVWSSLLAAWKGGRRVVLVFLWSAALLFLLLAGIGVFNYANVSADHHVPVREAFVVQGRSTVSGRTSKPYLVSAHWLSAGRDITLHVPRDIYQGLRPGQTLVALVHPGAFGGRWISAFSVGTEGESQSADSRLPLLSPENAAPWQSHEVGGFHVLLAIVALLFGVWWWFTVKRTVETQRQNSQMLWKLGEQALRGYAMEREGYGRYRLVGAKATILQREDGTEWSKDGEHAIGGAVVFYVRNPEGEYFMFRYHPDGAPYVKHMQHSMARFKLKAQYVEPDQGARG